MIDCGDEHVIDWDHVLDKIPDDVDLVNLDFLDDPSAAAADGFSGPPDWGCSFSIDDVEQFLFNSGDGDDGDDSAPNFQGGCHGVFADGFLADLLLVDSPPGPGEVENLLVESPPTSAGEVENLLVDSPPSSGGGPPVVVEADRVLVESPPSSAGGESVVVEEEEQDDEKEEDDEKNNNDDDNDPASKKRKRSPLFHSLSVCH